MTVEMYRMMLRIRMVELAIERLHHQGDLVGSFHSSMGQEAAAAGVCAVLRPDDLVTSTHRGHGHAIAKGVPLSELFAELFGYQNGCSGGRGGSMHLHHKQSGFLGENAIVAGGMPWVAGAAWAARRTGHDLVGVGFCGDGAGAQGMFSETLRIARTWGSPCLFVCENNHLAHSMPSERVFGSPGAIAEFAASFGLRSEFALGDDVIAVHNAADELVRYTRQTAQPAFLEVEVWRVRPHSLNDPDYRYRPRNIGAEYLQTHDPIGALAKQLSLSDSAQAQIEHELDQEIADAVESASHGRVAQPETAVSGVYSPALESVLSSND